jgi:hypothetical protein
MSSGEVIGVDFFMTFSANPGSDIGAVLECRFHDIIFFRATGEQNKRGKDEEQAGKSNRFFHDAPID